MTKEKEQVLQQLLNKVAVLNQKTEAIDNYVFAEKLSEAQDGVKEALSNTMGWTKPDWDQIMADAHKVKEEFENSLSEEQLKYYKLIKDYETIIMLANQRSGGQK